MVENEQIKILTFSSAVLSFLCFSDLGKPWFLNVRVNRILEELNNRVKFLKPGDLFVFSGGARPCYSPLSGVVR